MAKQNPGRVLASAAQVSKSEVDAKLKGVVAEEVAVVEAESAAVAAPVVDAAMLASAESIFAADASPVLVAQAGGTSGGMLAGGVSTGTLLAVGAGVLAIGGAVALASSGDDDNDDDGGDDQPVNPTITVTSAPASITEGGSGVTYTITTTGFNAGDQISYNLSGAGITATDVNQGLSGLITLDANGRAIFTVSAVSDGITEGAETLSFVASSGTRATSNTVTTTLNDAQVNQVFRLTPGVDSGPAFVGTAGDDTFDGRGFTFDQFDTIDGGAGTDRLITDFTVQDVFFTNTRNIEIVTTGGDADLGAVAADAGVQRVDLLGVAGDADITGFDAALTVNGNAGVNNVVLNLADAGNKTLNLGAGLDTVTAVAAAGAVAGGTQVNFTSGSVGNGTDGNVTLVNAGGNVVVNDEGTVLLGTIANQFNVVGLDANGAVDATQNRGNFQTVILGTQAGDTFTTAGFAGNVYINAGSGNDVLTSAVGAGERDFLVGGAGDDTVNVTTAGTGLAVVLAGGGNDTVNVGTNGGQVNVSLGDGDDTATFTGALELNTPGAASTTRDTLDGGAGRDTLGATSANLTAIDNSVANAVQSISNFEALTVTDTLAAALNTTRVQAGIDTVTLAAGTTGGNTVTFGGGVAGTLNLGAVAAGAISLASAGTGTSDSLTVANTAAAVAGAAVDAFDGRAIATTGVETLNVNTSAAGSATRQDIGGITGTTLATVNFLGGNSVDAGTVAARTVSAAGLTGAAGLTLVAGFTGAANNVGAVTGSANADSVTYSGGQFIAVNTGAGNDTVTIAAGSLAGGNNINGTLNGGDGTDALAMTAADAAAATVPNTPVSTKISGFEVLQLGSSAGANVIDLRFLGTTQRVISAGNTAGGLSILNLDNGGTFELTGALAGAASVAVRDADLRTTDSINIVLNGAGALTVADTLTVNNIETINVNSTYSGATAPAVASTLDLAANSATSVVVTGNNGVDFTGSTLALVTSFDASAVTAGGVTFAAQNAAATTIRGGAGDDVLSGNIGNDTITLGAGSDTVVFGVDLAANGRDTINGFKAGALGDNGGDLLQLNGFANLVTARDFNGATAGIGSFNATASNTTTDLTITGTNTELLVVVDGAATINLSNVKAASGNTAQFGEILVSDGASQYVLHASATDSSVATLYRVFDSNAAASSGTAENITASVEIIGVINLTNTVGELVAANFG